MKTERASSLSSQRRPLRECGLGDQLPKVVVIRSLKLVFDDHCAAGLVLRYEVDAERACGLLALNVRKRQVENVVQDIDVLFQPGRQVVSLVLPHFAEWNALDLSDSPQSSR
jgi:hypothetical protein